MEGDKELRERKRVETMDNEKVEEFGIGKGKREEGRLRRRGKERGERKWREGRVVEKRGKWRMLRRQKKGEKRMERVKGTE